MNRGPDQDLILKAVLDAKPGTAFVGLLPALISICRVVTEAAASPGSQGHLPLHRACLCSSITNVKYLIQLHPDALRSADNKGQVSKATLACVSVSH